MSLLLARHIPRCRARGGAMINGCLVLVASMAIVTTLAGKFAGAPPFHVVVATVTLMVACLLWRTSDTPEVGGARPYHWQMEALACIGAPAALSAMAGYLWRLEGDILSGTSVYLYIAGTAVYIVTCIIRYSRGGPE